MRSKGLRGSELGRVSGEHKIRTALRIRSSFKAKHIRLMKTSLSMDIVQIPVLKDNYIYLLHDADSGVTAAVDPAEAEPVLRALRDRGWTLSLILNTHHHGDHVGANESLRRLTGCEIVGRPGVREPIPGLVREVQEGDRVRIGRYEAQVLEVPGHTQSHIAYWFEGERALFCGDTLFSLGCGRLLGGTADALWSSLQRFRKLPRETRVFCAHEYTESNGRFARTVDPENQDLVTWLDRVATLRANHQPTVPSEMALECRANPFLRPDSPAIRKTLGMSAEASDLEVFSRLRSLKDHF